MGAGTVTGAVLESIKHQRTLAEYRLHFAKSAKELCPEVFEELRDMVPLYKRIFGDDKDGFHRIFDIRKNEYLRRIRSDLDVAINEPFFNTPIYFGMFGQHVEKYDGFSNRRY